MGYLWDPKISASLRTLVVETSLGRLGDMSSASCGSMAFGVGAAAVSLCPLILHLSCINLLFLLLLVKPLVSRVA